LAFYLFSASGCSSAGAALIANIVAVAVWNLTLKIVFGLIVPGNLRPTTRFSGALALSLR
jgi:hypothetical protein